MPRVGVIIGSPGGFGDDWASLSAEFRRATSAGVHTIWLTQHLGFDALTFLAAVGGGGLGPELGTAVVPVQPRHPVVLAQHALTTQAACAGRLALGIGLGHRATLDTAYGLSTPRSVRFLTDYLDVLQPLLSAERADGNSTYPLRTKLLFSPPEPPPILVAALGPRMLEVAGARTAGTITWMTGPRTLAQHTVPTLTRAAAEHGRPAPRVVACLPVCVTDDIAAARARTIAAYKHYQGLPSYAAMLDTEGLSAPGEIAIVGDEKAVATAVAELGEAGVTDLAVMLDAVAAADLDRTWDFLSCLSIQTPGTRRQG